MLKDSFRSVVNIFFHPRCVLCESDAIEGSLCDVCTSLCSLYPSHAFNTLKDEYGALFYYEFSMKKLIIKIKFFRGISQSHALIRLINGVLDRGAVVENLKEFVECELFFKD